MDFTPDAYLLFRTMATVREALKDPLKADLGAREK